MNPHTSSANMLVVLGFAIDMHAQREVHWPSFFYFHCKYSLWLALIGGVTVTSVTTEINCQALVCGFFLFIPAHS